LNKNYELFFYFYFKKIKDGRRRWPRNLEQAKECRDNLAKSIYSRLFGWIIKSINGCLNLVDMRCIYKNLYGIFENCHFVKYQ
jgi:myosin heavy subunit